MRLVFLSNVPVSIAVDYVDFIGATLPDLTLADPVDAVVGRLIFLHPLDPVSTVRVWSGMVCPGGVVTF